MIRRKVIFIVVMTALLLAVAAILLFMQAEDTEVEITCPLKFFVSCESGAREISAWYSKKDGTYYVFLPSYADLSNTVAEVSYGNDIILGDSPIAGGESCKNYALNEKYDLKYDFDESVNSKLEFVRSANIAAMYIETASGSMQYVDAEKGNKESGSITVIKSNGELDYSGELNYIKTRGNTSLIFSKKPYSIRLHDAGDLLGMGKAEKWILLADYRDKSHIRNKFVYDFAGEVGLQYSPDCEWVDLYLNGEYAGLYLLTEKNEIAENRIEIDEPTGNVNSSFVVSRELEDRLISQDYTYVKTETGQALRVHQPDNATKGHLGEIKTLFQEIENAIISSDTERLTDYIDLDSWVRKYILEEVTENFDAIIISSFYYRNNASVDSKVYAGPVWDYDGALGFVSDNPNCFIANRLYTRTSRYPLETRYAPWFYCLYHNEIFYNRIKSLYESDFLPVLNESIEKIDAYAERISSSRRMDGIRYNYDGESDLQVEEIKDFLAKRIEFLNSAWIDGVNYCNIYLDSQLSDTYSTYAVVNGETFDELPALEKSEYGEFLGWYYEGTNEPYDNTAPVTEDLYLYARWSNQGLLHRDNQYKLALASAAAVVVFLAVFIVIDVKRRRSQK